MNRPFPAYSGDEPYIFVCYSHRDASEVYPELIRLNSLGFRIWYDEGIEAGSEWREEIAIAIKHCSLFIYFVTPDSAKSNTCRKEVNLADKDEIPIVAIHLEETELPASLDLTLSDLQALPKYDMPNQEYQEKLQTRLGFFFGQPVLQSISDAQETDVSQDQLPPLPEKARKAEDQAMASSTYDGLCGAPGVAIGTAVVIYPPGRLENVPERKIRNIAEEIALFEHAVKETRDEIQLLANNFADRLRQEDLNLFLESPLRPRRVARRKRGVSPLHDRVRAKVPSINEACPLFRARKPPARRAGPRNPRSR